MDERQYYARAIEKHKSKADSLTAKLSCLTSRTVSAELQLKKSKAQVNRSTKRSDEVMHYNEGLAARIKELEATVQEQQERIVDLELDLDEKNQQLTLMEEASPIQFFCKVRSGRRGATSWPLYVWELILEQLVNGTPPTSVNANIVMFLQHFSPRIVIKELPSIWTIRRGRSVLFVVVETLAAYRIAKAKRWGQLHTDGTGRRQIAFQDLAISIEEDVNGFIFFSPRRTLLTISLFDRPLLLTSCIIPTDERSETICEAILHALHEKGKNLDEWIVVHEKLD